MSRTRIPIVWGQGLDRATGALVADHATFLDIRNLLVRDAKLLARGGLVPAGDPFTGEDTPSSDIVGMFPFRAQLGMIIVTYDRTSQSIDVWNTDGFGESPTWLGQWDVLIDGAPLPIISGAESEGKFFLAHAEPLFNYRIRTIYYDPAQSPGSQLVDFDQDLDGDGSAHTYFRGVFTYLDYVMCYGFGTASDPNRPETIHVTLPGQPTVMDPQQYFIAGTLGEAITGLGVVPTGLRVNKKGRSYIVTGTGAADFGIFPLEEIYGQVNDRASFAAGANLYMWTEQGPRVAGSDGTGFSQDIALPLELDAPQPDTLAQRGDDAYCWSVYEPEQRIGLFGFPILDPAGNKTLVYVVSLRTPGVIRWTYYEIAKLIYSSCLVIEGAPSVGSTLTAFADTMSASDTGQSGTGRTVHLQWDSNALIGGESAQVILTNTEDGSGPTIVATLPATVGTMHVDLPGLLAFAKFDLAVRYVKGGFATPGYESTNPDDWTAGTAADSKTDVTTTCSAITGLSATWQRTSPTTHTVDLSFVLPEIGQGFQEQVSDDGATWVDAETPAAPYNARVISHLMLDADIGTTKHFRLRVIGAEGDGAYVALGGVYIGPTSTPNLLKLVQSGGLQLWLKQKGLVDDKLQIQTSADGATAWSTRISAPVTLLDPGVDWPFVSSVAVNNTTYARARYVHTSFGVDDPGPWTGTLSIFYANGVPGPPHIMAHVAALWMDDNEVIVTFDAVTQGTGAMVLYTDENGLRALETSTNPATSIDITDIRDLGTDAHWQPFLDNTQDPSNAPTETVKVWPIETTGGRFMLGVLSGTIAVLMTEGPLTTPLGILVTQPVAGVGEINVEWGNSSAALAGPWPVSVTRNPPGFFLQTLTNDDNPDAAGATQTVSGPPLGIAPLPATGSQLVVRVVYMVRGDRWGLPVTTTYVMT